MPIKMDMSNPDAFKRPAAVVVDPGLYQFRLMNKLREVPCAAPSTNTMTKVQLKILNEGEFEGKVIWGQIVFSPKTMWNWYQFCRSCGIAHEDMESAGGVVPFEDLDGAELTALVDTEMYQNKPRSVITAYRFEGDDENAG